VASGESRVTCRLLHPLFRRFTAYVTCHVSQICAGMIGNGAAMASIMTRRVKSSFDDKWFE